jgi:HAD superfamily hydrolase (TIGR01509 family)
MSTYVFIWDFDGVIVNTPHEEAWKKACELYGIKGFNHEFYMKYVSGLPRLNGGMNILEKLGYFSSITIEDREVAVKRFTDLKTNVYLEMINEGKYSLNKEVVEFIVRSREIGIFQILASASKNVLKIAVKEEIKPNVKLIDIFDINVSGSGTTKEDVFRMAVTKAHAKFNNIKCIVFFEDSPQGIQASKLLGGIAVGCFNKELKNYGADFIIDNFASLMPQKLLKIIGCR